MKITGRLFLLSALTFSAVCIYRAEAQSPSPPIKPQLPWAPVWDPGRPGYQDGKLSNAHDCNAAPLGCNIQDGFWKTGDGPRYRYGHIDRFGVR